MMANRTLGSGESGKPIVDKRHRSGHGTVLVEGDAAQLVYTG